MFLDFLNQNLRKRLDPKKRGSFNDTLVIIRLCFPIKKSSEMFLSAESSVMEEKTVGDEFQRTLQRKHSCKEVIKQA